jgi:hypothetical protein
VHRRLAVVVLGVVAIAVAGATFVGPWWVVSSLPDNPPIATFAFGPFGYTYTAPSYPGTRPMTYPTYYENYTVNNRHLGTLLLSGAALVGAALVSGSGMVALIIVSGSSPRLRKPAAFLGLLASVLIVAAVLGVLLLLPAALNQDSPYPPPLITSFWGSAPVYSHELQDYYVATWGAGWAWYALLAAAVLFLTDGIVLLRAKTPSAAPAAPKATQQP